MFSLRKFLKCRYRFFAVLNLLVAICISSGCRVTSMGQNTLGVQLYNQGRYTEALQQFQTAQTSDPSNPDTYYNLASTYHKLGIAQKETKLIEQAESLYNQCLDLQPNHVDCHRGLAVLLHESNRPDRALALLKNWASANPQSADPRIELSRLHQELGQTKVAEQYLDEALAINPNDYRAWSAKGHMRQMAGEDSQALQNFQHSLAINSMQPDVLSKVAELNIKMATRPLSQPNGGWTVQNPNPTNRY
jgi:tetratricopeptide (TPR) repeat protein